MRFWAAATGSALALALVLVAAATATAEQPRGPRRADAGSLAALQGLRPPRSKEAAEERPPPPALTLVITAPTTRGPWTMRVTNVGGVPVHLAADARLLALDVTPRSARRPTRCALPSDMRPGDDLETPLVVPPGRSYAETFEPRLYCFGAQLATLAGGATVVARLGWPEGNANRGPYAASPIDGIEPAVAPLKSLDAAPIVLPDEPTPASVPLSPAQPPEVDIPRLTVTPALAVDAETFDDIQIPVTLRNDGSRAVMVRFLPETLGFWVTGPNGVYNCSWPAGPAAPNQETFSTLAPKQSAETAVLLSAYCLGHVFDYAGLYVVRPRLDTRRASGISAGYRTFDGVVVAAQPTVVRLHRGAGPSVLRNPRLEPSANSASR
jgi:hypothetical protein